MLLISFVGGQSRVVTVDKLSY